MEDVERAMSSLSLSGAHELTEPVSSVFVGMAPIYDVVGDDSILVTGWCMVATCAPGTTILFHIEDLVPKPGGAAFNIDVMMKRIRENPHTRDAAVYVSRSSSQAFGGVLKLLSSTHGNVVGVEIPTPFFYMGYTHRLYSTALLDLATKAFVTNDIRFSSSIQPELSEADRVARMEQLAGELLMRDIDGAFTHALALSMYLRDLEQYGDKYPWAKLGQSTAASA